MRTRLARKAYEGYRNHTGGKSLATGAVIPEWDDLRHDIQDAWKAAVAAICEALGEEVRVEVENAGYEIRQRLAR